MRSSGKVSPDAKWKLEATYSPSKALIGSGASAAGVVRGAARTAATVAAATMAAVTTARGANELRAGIGFLVIVRRSIRRSCRGRGHSANTKRVPSPTQGVATIPDLPPDRPRRASEYACGRD